MDSNGVATGLLRDAQQVSVGSQLDSPKIQIWILMGSQWDPSGFLLVCQCNAMGILARFRYLWFNFDSVWIPIIFQLFGSNRIPN